jgi:hypothetical protein
MSSAARAAAAPATGDVGPFVPAVNLGEVFDGAEDDDGDTDEEMKGEEDAEEEEEERAWSGGTACRLIAVAIVQALPPVTAVGPARYRSPRHRMPFNSRSKG